MKLQLPSQRMPPLPWHDVDWRLRAAVGRPELSRIWQELWQNGVVAGRLEGIVGTVLVGLVLVVIVLVVVVAVRGSK